jgi:hypothetical protein
MSILNVLHLISSNAPYVLDFDPKELLKLEEERKKIAEFLKKEDEDKNESN